MLAQLPDLVLERIELVPLRRIGKRVDASLALAQVFKELEPVGMAQSAGDQRELSEDRLLGTR